MAEHEIVKAEKLSLTAVGMLEEELVVPGTFQREGIDQYRGAKDDTISVTVEGVLPFRSYGWRNNRNSPITFDEYAETKVSLTFGGDLYSAVKLTDEQYEMDLTGWGKLLRPQSKAIARGLQRECVNKLVSQTYAVTIANTETKLRSALYEARRVMNRFRVPAQSRWLLVGSDFEAALLADEKIVLAQNSGDSVAEGALREASLGRVAGFNIVTSTEIPADAAFAYVPSAFVLATAAPAVPQSVPFGATASFEGYALRWIRDYDSNFLQDRSVVNTYWGVRAVDDILVGWDDANNVEVVSEARHFVRGVKLTLGGTNSVYPVDGGELATITGVSNAAAWSPTGPVDLS